MPMRGVGEMCWLAVLCWYEQSGDLFKQLPGLSFDDEPVDYAATYALGPLRLLAIGVVHMC